MSCQANTAIHPATVIKNACTAIVINSLAKFENIYYLLFLFFLTVFGFRLLVVIAAT
jgi:hypothetical protein